MEKQEPLLNEDEAVHKNQPLTIRSKDPKHTKLVVLLGSAILNVFLVALNIITGVYMAQEEVKLRADSTLCLNCSDLRLHPDDDFSIFSVYADGNCCLRKGGNYSDMVDRLVERKLKEDLVSESRPYKPLYCDADSKSRVPVVKLIGRRKNLYEASASRFYWLKWDEAVLRSNSEANRGELTHDGLHITVGSTGIYQIYSQLVFQKSQPEGVSAYSESPNKYYLHAIYKYSASGYDERILGGSYTYFDNQDGDTMTTSYIGSPYQLRKGDKIGVKVHDFSEVVPSNLTNFFGMHLIQ